MRSRQIVSYSKVYIKLFSEKEKYCVIGCNSSIPLLFVLVIDDDDVVLVLVIFIIFGKEKKYLSKKSSTHRFW